MAPSPITRSVIAVLVVAALAGCDVAGIGIGRPPAERHWIVEVQNQSTNPATLIVASETEAGTAGQAVGTVDPGTVPPSATVMVTFGIPGGGDWAIFVNPRPDQGPLVKPGDVPPNAVGRMPFKIIIDANGEPGALFPGPAVPGWFGN